MVREWKHEEDFWILCALATGGVITMPKAEALLENIDEFVGRVSQRIPCTSLAI